MFVITLIKCDYLILTTCGSNKIDFYLLYYGKVNNIYAKEFLHIILSIKVIN